jgi:hypothetical protein
MKSDTLPKGWLTFLLGTINGLIVGVIASLAIYFYNEYWNWRLLYGDLAGAFSAHFVQDVEPIMFIIVLCLFISAFSVASYIIHRFWFNRVKSIMWLWQYVGVAAVVVGTLIILFVELLEYSSSGITMFSYHNFLSLKFARFCLLALGCLAVINYIYASVLRACAVEYFQKANVKLNTT